jgi:hypothetical protein
MTVKIQISCTIFLLAIAYMQIGAIGTAHSATAVGQEKYDGSGSPEISINADSDTVRALLIRHMLKDKFNLEKEEPHQLVFKKEMGGVSGWTTGILLGNDSRKGHMIVSYVITGSANSCSVMPRMEHVFANKENQGTPYAIDDKKTKKSLYKYVEKIKEEAEKR